MGWFQKGLSSATKQAQKMQFEADKMMRVKREEAGVADLRSKTQAKLAELGQAALALYEAGSLQDPAIAAVAGEIAGLQQQIKAQEAKVEALKAEQWHEEGAPAAAPQPAATAPAPQPVASAPAAVPQQPAPSASLECPSCHTPVRSTAAFCPECGTKLR